MAGIVWQRPPGNNGAITPFRTWVRTVRAPETIGRHHRGAMQTELTHREGDD